jgi:hypothetical protein
VKTICELARRLGSAKLGRRLTFWRSRCGSPGVVILHLSPTDFTYSEKHSVSIQDCL